MSKASEIRAAFNDGFQAGIVDTVGQDKARLNLATASADCQLRWP